MRIDCYLSDLTGRELVRALYFERGGAGLGLEAGRQGRRNERRRAGLLPAQQRHQDARQSLQAREDVSRGNAGDVKQDTGLAIILVEQNFRMTMKVADVMYFVRNGIIVGHRTAAGGFWFTDLGKSYGRLMDRGAVYYARTDGSLIREVIFPIMTPNGVGLSPDGRTLYVTETETSRIWSFVITGEGQLEKLPWPSPNGGKLLHGLPGYQRFDSLAVEAGGNICVATLVRAGISVFSPNGDLIEFHEAPEVFCTNICFGGDGLRTAFITLSGTGRLIAVDWPRPGLPLHDPLSASGGAKSC